MLEASRFTLFSHHLLYSQLHNDSLAIKASSFGRSTKKDWCKRNTLEKYDAIYKIYLHNLTYVCNIKWIFLPKPTPTNHSKHLKASWTVWICVHLQTNTIDLVGTWRHLRARAPHTLDRGTKAPLGNGVDVLNCGWFKWWKWCGEVFLPLSMYFGWVADPFERIL